MYLKIKNGTKTKQYTLTNNYNRPYIALKNGNKTSFLPLTTKTTNGIYLKVKDGNQTMRPLDYVTGTYTKTAVNSAGLSSTTGIYSDKLVPTAYGTERYVIRVDPVTGKKTRASKYGTHFTHYNNTKKSKSNWQALGVTNYKTGTYRSKILSYDTSYATFGRISVSGNNATTKSSNGNSGAVASKTLGIYPNGASTAKYLDIADATRESQYQTTIGYNTVYGTRTTKTYYRTDKVLTAYSGVSSSSIWQ